MNDPLKQDADLEDDENFHPEDGEGKHLPLDPEVQQALPGSKLTVQIIEAGDELAGKRISVVLQWPTGPERPDRSVRLVAWRYRQRED